MRRTTLAGSASSAHSTAQSVRSAVSMRYAKMAKEAEHEMAVKDAASNDGLVSPKLSESRATSGAYHPNAVDDV